MLEYILVFTFNIIPVLAFVLGLKWHASWPKLTLYGGMVYVAGCLLFMLLYESGNSDALHLAFAFAIPVLVVSALVVMLARTQHVWNRR